MSDTSNGNPLVALRDVHKTFGEGSAAVHALRGVDLDVHAGELLMLMGPSGCGKTTLISIISGVLSPTKGQVHAFGFSWHELGEDAKARRRAEYIGYVFQQFHLVPQLPSVENVAVPLLIRGMKRDEALQRAAEALGAVGLGDRLGDPPRQLSGGMQQRVSVARALVGRPRLLVCDEPTANLDADNGHAVMELLAEASQRTGEHGEPCAVIVVTHDARTESFADRIVFMEDGQLRTSPPAGHGLPQRKDGAT
jgi:putative ABC transport system ATP-binding protein